MTRPQTLLALSLLLTTPLLAQSTTHTPTTIPALFLSDIHLDPFADPAKVARLNAAPIAQWPAILTAPASPTQPQDSAALSNACPTRGIDTPNVLWQSSLHAIRTHAASVRFVTVSGDLLAHSFDCKYKTLLPAATHADYVAFTEKTAAYIVTGLRATLPGIPVYIALGNNDSGCGDYHLDPAHDDLLARLAPIVADAAGLPDADRASAPARLHHRWLLQRPSRRHSPHPPHRPRRPLPLRQLHRLRRHARSRTRHRATRLARRTARRRPPAQRARLGPRPHPPRRRSLRNRAQTHQPLRRSPDADVSRLRTPRRSPHKLSPTPSTSPSSATPTPTRCAC